MLIGAHVPVAGGPAKAVQRGDEIGCGAIQIFNQNPRGWKPTIYDDDKVGAYHAAVEGSGVQALLIHAVYLLNTASTDKEIEDKTLISLTESLRAGDRLGAAGVVLHAGSAKGEPVADAISRAGKVIAEALAQSDSCPLHLENTAGAGGTLGRSFAELAELIESSGGGPRLGICLDSCHLLASGYDVTSNDAVDQVLAEAEAQIGLDRLGSLHVNDSQTPLGSNRDRHAPVGIGEIGERGIAAFLSHPRFDGLPCVLETAGEGKSEIDADEVAKTVKLRSRGVRARKRRSG